MPVYIKPFGFILLRAIGATLLFWLTAFFFQKEKMALKHHVRLMFCGLFGVATNQLFFFAGLNITSPISASVMMTINPIMVLIMSAIILKEKLRTTRILGIALGLAGALFLITKGGKVLDIFSADRSFGNFLVLLNAASYGIYLVIVKPLMKSYQPITVIKWVFAYGLLFVIPFGFHQFDEVQWNSLPSDAIWRMGFVVLGTTYLAYLLNVFALKTVTSTTVSFYIYLQPLVATIVAVLLGKDHLTAILIISAVLLFSGVYLVSFSKR